MRKLGRIGVLAVLGLWAPTAMAGETKIPLDKVPKAVGDAFKKKFPEATLKAAIKEEEDGKVTYELESTLKGGLTLDAVLTPAGEFVAIEKEIRTADLPAKALAAVKEKYPKASLEKAEMVDTKGKVSYEAVVKKADGKSATLLFDKDGKLLGEEK